MTSARLSLLFLFSAALVPAPAARAQVSPASSQPSSPEETRRRAKELFGLAETQYRLGRFTQALADYQAALKLRHHPSIIFNIAQCHRQLKNAERAIFFYKLFLADWERIYPGTKPANETEVLGYVSTLEAELRAAALRARAPSQSTGELLLKDVPAGAQVLIDGVLRGQGPIQAPIAVTPGKRLVRVEQPGYEGWSQVVTVVASKSVSAAVRLHRLVNVGIDSQPIGAAVIVDGAERGWTPLRLTLPAERRHALELRKQGYLTLSQSMTLEPRESAWASYTLEPSRAVFGSRNEWFAFEPALALARRGFVAGGLALNIVTLKWRHASWTILTLGGGGGADRFYSHLETRVGYPLRFGRRGQHQLRAGLGFGILAISVDAEAQAQEEEAWIKTKGTDDRGGSGPRVAFCLTPSVEYLYQTMGRTLVGGGFRALAPITRDFDGDEAPAVVLLTARVGWASNL